MKAQKRRRHLNPNTVQLIRRIMGGVLLFILVGGLVWGTWYVTHLPSLTIETVSVDGGETIPHELVRELAEAELTGEYVRLIPKRFAFLYPESAIYNSVAEVDRIKDITIERLGLREVVITFSEYTPDALWCNKETEECVFLDDTGYAFAVAPDLSGGNFLRMGKIGVTPVSGVQAFDPNRYQTVKAVRSLLASAGWFVALAEIDAAGDAYLFLNEGGELKVTLADAPEQIVENLFTVLSAPEFSEVTPGNFEYIDLRFGNKVFVNELEPEPEVTLASTSVDELE